MTPHQERLLLLTLSLPFLTTATILLLTSTKIGGPRLAFTAILIGTPGLALLAFHPKPWCNPEPPDTPPTDHQSPTP